MLKRKRYIASLFYLVYGTSVLDQVFASPPLTHQIEVPSTVQACLNASLVDRPIHQLPTAEDMYIDGYCSNLILKEFDPANQGTLSIFGSASVKPNHVLYYLVRQFVGAWSDMQKTLPDYQRSPLLSGGGPGVMEAANCAVNHLPIETSEEGKTRLRLLVEAMHQGPKRYTLSLGFGSAFRVPASQAERYQSGSKLWELNPCVTDGYLFRSISLRESEMIDHARMFLVAPGGFGTEWELFETLTKIQTGKIPLRPNGKPPMVILFQPNQLDAEIPVNTDEIRQFVGGNYKEIFAKQSSDISAYWQALMHRIRTMRQLGTIKDQDLMLMRCAHTVSEAVTLASLDAMNETIPDQLGRCDEFTAKGESF